VGLVKILLKKKLMAEMRQFISLTFLPVGNLSIGSIKKDKQSMLLTQTTF